MVPCMSTDFRQLVSPQYQTLQIGQLCWYPVSEMALTRSTSNPGRSAASTTSKLKWNNIGDQITLIL